MHSLKGFFNYKMKERFNYNSTGNEDEVQGRRVLEQVNNIASRSKQFFGKFARKTPFWPIYQSGLDQTHPLSYACVIDGHIYIYIYIYYMGVDVVLQPDQSFPMFFLMWFTFF